MRNISTKPNYYLVSCVQTTLEKTSRKLNKKQTNSFGKCLNQITLESFVFRKRLNLIVLVGSAICSKFQPSLACTSFCSSYTPGEKCIVRYFFNQICKKKKHFDQPDFRMNNHQEDIHLKSVCRYKTFKKDLDFILDFYKDLEKTLTFIPFHRN